MSALPCPSPVEVRAPATIHDVARAAGVPLVLAGPVAGIDDPVELAVGPVEAPTDEDADLGIKLALRKA